MVLPVVPTNVLILTIVLRALLWYVECVVEGVDGYEIPLIIKQSALTVHGISVHRVPLRNHDPTSPYALAVSTGGDYCSTELVPVVTSYNFLATQVWPSARTAAIVMEKYMTNETTKPVICEFGCGPGLPSLTSATCNPNCHVIATDIDPLALELVRQAAIEQNVSDRVTTLTFDLTTTTANIPHADLYIFSDVFENSHVAKGAVQITIRILNEYVDSKIWVFAQSDRAQREVYLKELRHHLHTPELAWSHSLQPTLEVQHPHSDGKRLHNRTEYNLNDRLWLCNIDETNVFYG